MTEYDAIVYDLDGTLVRLDVDWGDVAKQCAAVLRARGHDPAGADIWEMREIATENGLLERVDETIAEFERDGARSAQRLALADALPHDAPVGVCSLNCEAACRIALQLNGIDGYVDAVVGRDSHEAVKPDPGPLLQAVETLGASPAQSLFIGDSESDRTTARRAGLEFKWVEDCV